MKTPFLLFSILIGLGYGCGSNDFMTTEQQVTVEDSTRVNKLLYDYLAKYIPTLDTSKSLPVDGDTIYTTAWIHEFYTKENYQAVWFNKGHLTIAGDSLCQLLLNAEDYGLIPYDYHAFLIDTILQTAYDSARAEYSVNKLAHAELLLTDAFIKFAVHASVGRLENDSSTTRSWRASKLDTNLIALLQQVIKQKNPVAAIHAIEPQQPEYWAVKRMLKAFREEFGKEKWSVLPKLEEDTLAFKAALIQRLIAGHDLDTTISNKEDSLAIANALKSFQKRVGLEPDGKYGRNTIRALNITYEERIYQMAMNLERWRIEPDPGKRYVWVNIPEFRMHVMDADSMVMQSRIVVGSYTNQTPELNSKIYQMVLYPFWHVPYSIATKEILPHLKKDSTYLKKHNYEVFDRKGTIMNPSSIEWNKYSQTNLPYKFRQKIGSGNSLGILKFNFQNKYGVYMHDTNSKRFFGKETRALSHGCMRLEKYMDLAYYLIREDSLRLPKDTFDVYMKTKQQRTYNLRTPIPIYVRYYTCVLDEDGRLILLNDIYGRDKRMARVFYKI